MSEREPNPTDQAADPNRVRVDDFTGPPVTAAEVALLQKLFLVGADLACEAAARVKAKLAEAAAEAGDPAAAKAAEQAAAQATKTFEHMSRIARLTLGLKAKLVMDLETWRRRRAQAASGQAKASENQRRNELKQKIGPILEEVVGQAHGAKAAASVAPSMNRWFAERDYETQLPNLPIGELIGRIAGAVGYKIDWGLWQDQYDWTKAAEASCPPEPGPPTITKIEWQVVYPEWQEKQMREAAEAAAAAREQTATAEPAAPPADASTPQGPPPDEPAPRTGWAGWADP